MDLFNDFIANYTVVEKLISGYLLLISGGAFVLMGIDKRRAVKDQWRIKESTLILVSAMGGGIGALMGMIIFKHKINKKKFYLGIPLCYLFNRLVEIIVFTVI